MKTKIILLIATILLTVNIKISAQAYEEWNSGFSDASDNLTIPYEFASAGFSYQSDLYYMQEMNSFFGFSGSDFLAFNLNGMLRGIGDDDAMDSGSDTSTKDFLLYANDVPISDGMMPLLLAVFGWVALISIKGLVRKQNKYRI